jgi:hypothetical protein
MNDLLCHIFNLLNFRSAGILPAKTCSQFKNAFTLLPQSRFFPCCRRPVLKRLPLTFSLLPQAASALG